MDWSTVFLSAGVSAVVGAVVSLLTVSQTTVKRARAERREAARVALAARVAPLIDDLARYRFRRSRPKPLREPDLAEFDDHATVVGIRAAAADLPPWRRRLVDRRLRAVFGTTWTDLAIDYPTKPDANESRGAWLAVALENSETPDTVPDYGLLHRAYSARPGDPSQDELTRALRRLAAAR